MRPRCNIINQVDFERLFNLSIFTTCGYTPHPIRRLAALRLSWQLTSYLARGGVNLALEQLEEVIMLNLNTLVALLTVIIRISLAEAFDKDKISVEQINTMVHTYQLLARPCGLSFPGVKLNSCDQYYRSIPATLSPPTPGLKSCSAQRLSLFKLCGHSSRAGWRDWSTACRDVTALICQVDFGNLILKRNSHLETSLNQSLQL